eukprot:gene2950-12958_t
MRIPGTAILSVGGSVKDNLESEPIMRLLTELKDPDSKFKPYLDTLPRPDEISYIGNIPAEYAMGDSIPGREPQTDKLTDPALRFSQP